MGIDRDQVVSTEAWSGLRCPPPLLPGPVVHVWRIETDARTAGIDPEDFVSILSGEERTRCDRLRLPEDRRSYILSHAALRILLGEYSGLGPNRLSLIADPGGKPRLADRNGDLRFNLTHTGGMALVAIARGREVGVDVERLRPGVAVEAVTRRYFSDAECAGLLALPDSLRERAFFEIWTRKESFLKATGAGIAGGLEEFDVSVVPAAPSLLLETRRDPLEAGRWWLQDLHVGDLHAAAVACARLPGEEPAVYTYDLVLP